MKRSSTYRPKRSLSEDQACIFNGVVYRPGSQFSLSCRHRCLCDHGLVSCQDTCWLIESGLAPSKQICPHGAELIAPNRGRCCREWACREDVTSRDARTGGIRQQILQRIKRTEERIIECDSSIRKFTTKWTTCSVICGPGYSIRITNRNSLCSNITQIRYCNIRPCQKYESENKIKTKYKLFPYIQHQIPECWNTFRYKSPISISIKLQPQSIAPPSLPYFQIPYNNNHNRTTITQSIWCSSKRKYRPRFCGDCAKPSKTKTKRIEFLCKDGSFVIERYNWIQQCIKNDSDN